MEETTTTTNSKAGKGLGIAGLVLGILAAVVSFIPCLGMYAMFPGIIGLVLSVIFGALKPELARECENWDKYYVMEIILFFTGVVVRLLLTTDMGNKYLLSQ